MPEQTAILRANTASRLTSILLSDTVDLACARLLEALLDLGYDGFCLGASDPTGAPGGRRFVPVAWRGGMTFTESAGGQLGDFLDSARATGWLLVSLGQSDTRNWVLAVNRPADPSPAPHDALSLLELYGHAFKAVVLPARVVPPVETSVTPLSGIQHNYLRWAAEGKSSTDIAMITGATRRAVEYHFAEILRKLGVSSRAQAVAWLVQADAAPWSVPQPATLPRVRSA